MIDDAQRIKRALIKLAGNAGLDQPAHSRRLIRAIVARLQNQWILHMWTIGECPDQTARMRMLIRTFTVYI